MQRRQTADEPCVRISSGINARESGLAAVSEPRSTDFDPPGPPSSPLRGLPNLNRRHARWSDIDGFAFMHPAGQAGPKRPPTESPHGLSTRSEVPNYPT